MIVISSRRFVSLLALNVTQFYWAVHHLMIALILAASAQWCADAEDQIIAFHVSRYIILISDDGGNDGFCNFCG